MIKFNITRDSITPWIQLDTYQMGGQYMSHDVKVDSLSLAKDDVILYTLNMFDEEKNVVKYHIDISAARNECKDVETPIEKYTYAEAYWDIICKMYRAYNFKEHNEEELMNFFNLHLI